MHCTAADRARYRRRISAPLLDRFDLVVPLSRPDPDELLDGPRRGVGPSPPPVAGRPGPGRGPGRTELAPEAAALLAAKLRSGAPAARGLHKVARVARTVADLGGARRFKLPTSPKPCGCGPVAPRWCHERRRTGPARRGLRRRAGLGAPMGPAARRRGGGPPSAPGAAWRVVVRGDVARIWHAMRSSGSTCSWRGTRLPARFPGTRGPGAAVLPGRPGGGGGPPTVALVGTRRRPATASAWRRSSAPTSPPPA